jgi:hypothetical protein
MDAFNHLIHWIVYGLFAAFAWAPPAVGLAVISMLAGAGMLWILGKTSRQERIRAVKRLLWAHLFELRVFRDEPAVMWRAQKSLMTTNFRYMGLMLQPVLWMALPVAILLVHLDSFYGRAPLEVGSEAIVTASLHSPIDAQAPPPVLLAPPGVAVETEAVRAPAEREVSWRIRPSQPVSGDLRLIIDGAIVTKRIEAGTGFRFVPGRRVSSLLATLWHPDEARIQASSVEWVDVRTPEAQLEVTGIRAHWLVWFTLISMLMALLLKKRFGVTL